MDYEEYAPTLRRLAWIGLFTGLAGMIVVGQQARQANKEHQIQEAVRLHSSMFAPEMISLSLKRAALQLTPMDGYRRQTWVSWRYLQGDNYVLINPTSAGKFLCPGILADLVDANTDNSTGWPVASMDKFLRTFKGTEAVSVRASVPRFKEAPKNLEACPAFSFDAERKMLTYEGKPVAIWTNDQRAPAAAKQTGIEPAPVLVY